MRQRINISVSPIFYDELQRICKDYGFVNLCEICTALLKVFVEKVNRAEQTTQPKTETTTEIIEQMFREFENWEPVPDPDIVLKRKHAHTLDGKIFAGIMSSYTRDMDARTHDQDGQSDHNCESDCEAFETSLCDYYDSDPCEMPDELTHHEHTHHKSLYDYGEG